MKDYRVAVIGATSMVGKEALVDNIRKGTALNAVQVAEEMIKREWVHQEVK